MTTAGVQPGRSQAYETADESINPTAEEWRPWQVIDIDLAEPVPTLYAKDNRGRITGGVWLLLRVFTEPVGSLRLEFETEELRPETIVRSVPASVAALIRDRLREANAPVADGANGLPITGCRPGRVPQFLRRRHAVLESGPEVTAVVCTRDHPEGLSRCLRSLQGQSYPRKRILVVDNAPASQASREVVRAMQGSVAIRYVCEPAPGLSNARNRALRDADTELVAWIDDDEVADPHWLAAIVDGFVEQPDATAVCGVMVPAELETLAQDWFEEYGGHSKGRGFVPMVFSPASRDQHNPLFPLPPFGTGGNMAMKVAEIRRIGGFDRALGAGTRTFSAEDTRALTEILLRGGVVRYQPTAVTWHVHRRDRESFRRQLYGYGAGLSAFYTSLVWDHPLLLLPLAKLIPRAAKEFRDPDGPRLGGITERFPSELLKEHRRGMIRGPLEYAIARWSG